MAAQLYTQRNSTAGKPTTPADILKSKDAQRVFKESADGHRRLNRERAYLDDQPPDPPKILTAGREPSPLKGQVSVLGRLGLAEDDGVPIPPKILTAPAGRTQ